MVAFDDASMHFNAYFDGEIDEEDRESMSIDYPASLSGGIAPLNRRLWAMTLSGSRDGGFAALLRNSIPHRPAQLRGAGPTDVEL
jgi:hypothetical protein